MIALESLHLNDRNPRTITKKAFAKLCESIKRDPQFMELRPIVVDAQNIILGGNQRFRACVANGMTEVPDSWVRQAKDLTPAQRKRFIILDNAPDGISGDNDWDMLATDFDMGELAELGLDVSAFMGEDNEDAPACVCPTCGKSHKPQKNR